MNEKELKPIHPNKKMERESYELLDGLWDFTITKSNLIPDHFEDQINVPYPVESKLSKIERLCEIDDHLWYRKEIKINKHKGKILLHFGAIDQNAKIYIDSKLIYTHQGGFLPFAIEISDLDKKDHITLIIDAWDITDSSYLTVGNQAIEPVGKKHTRISGIWQSVWMEYVNEHYISNIDIETDYDHSCIMIKTDVQTSLSYKLNVHFIHNEYPDSNDRMIHLYNFKPWSYDKPYLYELQIDLIEEDKVIDSIYTYFAMRKIEVKKDGEYKHIYFNNQKIFLNGIIDGGYNSEGLYTPVSQETMLKDILMIKELGFNLIRKYEKIESDVFYYYCDLYGMLVLQDFVSGGEIEKRYQHSIGQIIHKMHINISDNVRFLFSRKNIYGKTMFIDEINQTVRILKHHPCIIAFSLFNDGKGQFDTALITKLIKSLDKDRLILSAENLYDQNCGDFYAIHVLDYKKKIKVKKDRLNLISEYGYLSYDLNSTNQKYKNLSLLNDAYIKLHYELILKNYPKLAGCIYYQFCDIEQEKNGIINEDRTDLKINRQHILEINQYLKNK